MELNTALSSNFSEMGAYLGPWSHQDLSVRESRASKEQVEGTRLGENEERDVAGGKLGRGDFYNSLDLREAAPMESWTCSGPQSSALISEESFAAVTNVHFSCSVMSNSLQPHEPQHARPPCPSPTPGVHPNSCPLSW